MIDQASSATSTADRLVLAAMRLFADKGYGSTSVADILREAGANSGSLYHAFPTKQDLLLEVLRRYRDGIGPMLLTPVWENVADPIERIFALLRAYRDMLAATDWLYGCPIGSLALELHEPDPPVRELLSVNFHGWTAAIADCLEEAHA
ncbi:MAG TPA: TetR/AcrR family transcriptional regulator, partial [Caulobacteraceae bacterium]